MAVSLDLVHKLFMKVRAYHKVRETLYFKVSFPVFMLVVVMISLLLFYVYDLFMFMVWLLTVLSTSVLPSDSSFCLHLSSIFQIGVGLDSPLE